MDLKILDIEVKNVTKEDIDYMGNITRHMRLNGYCSIDFCERCMINKIHRIHTEEEPLLADRCGITAKFIVLLEIGANEFKEKYEKFPLDRFFAAIELIEKKYLTQGFDYCELEV